MFVCTLDRATEVTELHGNGEYIYRLAIGYDDETDAVYSLLVIFSPLAGFGDGIGYELVFSLVEADPYGDDETVFRDGLHTKRFLSRRTDRRIVLEMIGKLVVDHIEQYRPAAVNMVTYVENLYGNTLDKYNWIASLFACYGYNAGPADPYHGRWIWMMRLP